MPLNNGSVPPDFIHIKAEESDKDVRIDLFLKERLGLSRSRIKGLIEDGYVRCLSGSVLRAVKPSYKIRPGDEIRVFLPKRPPQGLLPEPIPLNILYRDEDIVVIDKPPGMVVYPSAGHPSGTVVNALLYHIGRLCEIGGPLRPGVVHRLDKDTSGVMVFALSEKAYYGLVEIFKKRTLKRRYLCLACGDMEGEEGIINLPIGRSSSDRKRFSTRTRSPKEAVTQWRVLERFGLATFLEVSLKTGRTHQIRVHLASRGHPVCGDRTYGRKTYLELKRGRVVRFPRQMLHAETLAFRHPVTGEEMEFTSPIPDDMKEALEILRKTIYQRTQ